MFYKRSTVSNTNAKRVVVDIAPLSPETQQRPVGRGSKLVGKWNGISDQNLRVQTINNMEKNLSKASLSIEYTILIFIDSMKHISLYAINWILEAMWLLNLLFNLENQRILAFSEWKFWFLSGHYLLSSGDFLFTFCFARMWKFWNTTFEFLQFTMNSPLIW